MATRPARKVESIQTLVWVVLAIVAAIPLSFLVDRLGSNIPSVDLLAGHIQAVVVGCFLTLTIPFWPGEPWEKRTLVASWGLKIAIVLVAMLFYESLYPTLDAYSFYAGYNLSPDSAPIDPEFGFALGAGTKNVTSIVQFLKSMGASYHTVKLLFAYAGFAACYIAYRAGVLFVGKKSLVWLLLLLLTPSMLFWTGILGKDPLVVLGIAIYLYGAALYMRKPDAKAGWILFLGCFVAVSVRLWLLMILAIPLIYLFSKCGPPRLRKPLAGFMCLVLVGGVIGLAVQRQVTSTADLVPALAKVSQQWAEGGSAQKLEIPFDSIGGLLAFVPYGAFTALFRPLPLEVPNAFGLLAGLENAALLGIALYLPMRKGWRPLRDPRVVFLTLCLIAWMLVYSLISFQNLGTASRFKVQALPFLLLLFWSFLQCRRVEELKEP